LQNALNTISGVINQDIDSSSPQRGLEDRLESDLQALKNTQDFDQLESLTKGGVAAVNNAVLRQNRQLESEEKNLKDSSRKRSVEHDKKLANANETSKKKNLGPSTIRTLIKAVDSRPL
jgi:hypothetical protein